MVKCWCSNPNTNTTGTQVKHGTKTGALPTLIDDVITDHKHYIDNLFSDNWKRIKMNARIKEAGFTKQSGIDITEAVFSIAALEVQQ